MDSSPPMHDAIKKVVSDATPYREFVAKLSIDTKLDLYRVLLAESRNESIPEALADIGMALIMDAEVQSRLNINVGGRHG